MRYSIVWCVVAGLVMCCGQICEGKSLFAVASHANGKIKAYKIVGDHLEFQTTVEGTENFGIGATGLCSWGDYEKLFTTYESSETISWASSKTLNRESDDAYDAPETNLAGMAVDEFFGRLYVITRSGGRLYTFEFDDEVDTLVLLYFGGQPYRQLSGITGETFGIALDQGDLLNGGTLYVADGTTEIRCYNTYSWELTRTVDVGKSAISVDVDDSGYLYAGGHWNHNFLLRYDLLAEPNSPGVIAEKDLGAGITDVKVDPETGYLYTTTRRTSYGTSGTVEVYDASNWVWDDPNTLLLTDTKYDADFSGEGPAGITIGPLYKPARMDVKKADDVDEPVLPTDEFTYTITLRPGVLDETNVVVTDTLPAGVDFLSADPNDGCYDSGAHTVVWDVGFLPGYDPNTWQGGDPNTCFSLSVRVNYLAEPLSDLENIVVAESDEAYSEAREYTPVDCFGGGVIFVDCFATGSGSGTSWANAYTKLQNALTRAGEGCGNEIWVAQGLYSPGTDYDDTFEVPAGVSVYGGFCGTETSLTERDLSQYKIILTGSITNEAVVTMGWGATLDGVIVEDAFRYCIKGTDVPFVVQNCIVRNSVWHGIYCQDGRVTIAWSEVRDNSEYGVWVHSEQPQANRELRVLNSRIHDNSWDGVRSESSASEIRDSLIYGNGLAGDYFGLRLVQPISGGVIHNNTLAHNSKEGIRFVGENVPDVRNCILWGNAGRQLSGLDEDTVYWCCIQDCNDINAGNNINDDPLFAYSEEPYGLYHLSADSPCIDGGDATYVDPNGTGEWDIDGDDRVINNYVDIGADEFACEDVSNPIDWTFDGIIDPAELAIFAAAWLSHDPNDPLADPQNPNYVSDPNSPDYIWPASLNDYDARCDFDQDMEVNLVDWAYFAYYWRWRACWRNSGYGVWAPGESSPLQGGSQLEMMALSQPVALAESVEAYPAEPTVEEEYAQAKEIVAWLEDLWANDEEAREIIDKKAWREFMDQIYMWVANVEQEL